MNITALFSIKGGVGRTLLAAHLAESLTRRGLRVLVLELDPQNTLGHWFGMDPEIRFGLCRLQSNARELAQYGQRHATDVAFVPYGGESMRDLLYMENTVSGRSDWLANRLNALEAQNYDLVILDVAAGTGPMSRAAIHHADLVINVLQANSACYSTLPLFMQLQSELNLNNVVHVVNRYNGRNELQREIYKHLENQLGQALLGAAVSEDTSADAALASQQTLFRHHPQSPILRSIELLASQVASGLVPNNQADPQPVAQH